MVNLKANSAFTVLLAITSISVAIASTTASELEHNSTSYQQQQTIIIQTQLQNYEQPTLSEYEECQRLRDVCLVACASDRNPVKCTNECPLCPELYEQKHVVQGINATDAQLLPAVVPSANATSIIRLTNEIRNVIGTNLTAHTVNTIEVDHNVSHVGGKYGLGYNEHGSCCQVVRTTRHCESLSRRQQAERNCPEKRHRVCGEHCQARIMYAKRVRKCNTEAVNCREQIEYVTKRREKRHQPCHYIGNRWPYVSCKSGAGATRGRRNCARCLELPYVYVMQKGLPPRCMQCYSGYLGVGMPMFNVWSPWFALTPPVFGYEGDAAALGDDVYWNEIDGNQYSADDNDDGWVLEQTKCIRPDGTVIDNCQPSSGSGAGDAAISRPPKSEQYVDEQDIDDYYDESAGYDVPAQRRRRRNSSRRSSRTYLPFKRSIYSRRYSGGKNSI